MSEVHYITDLMEPLSLREQRYRTVIRQFETEVKRLRDERAWAFAEGVLMGAAAVVLLTWL